MTSIVHTATQTKPSSGALRQANMSQLVTLASPFSAATEFSHHPRKHPPLPSHNTNDEDESGGAYKVPPQQRVGKCTWYAQMFFIFRMDLRSN